MKEEGGIALSRGGLEVFFLFQLQLHPKPNVRPPEPPRRSRLLLQRPDFFSFLFNDFLS